MLKQKICGLILIVISVILTMMTKDGTISVLLIPLGIWLNLTKKTIIE